MEETYYREDLAFIHDAGFGSHADLVAPGVLELIDPFQGGLIVEIGCGSGALTRHLAAAGHRVLATDASPAMLRLVEAHLPEVPVAPLVLPDDEIPEADAIVSVGHALSYLETAAEVERSLRSMVAALRPGGVMVVDLLDLSHGDTRAEPSVYARAEEDWALISTSYMDGKEHLVRDMTMFRSQGSGVWRRDDEIHRNVLVDVAEIVSAIGGEEVAIDVRKSFGSETLPTGLEVVVARRL